jgi:hypothetical protein
MSSRVNLCIRIKPELKAFVANYAKSQNQSSSRLVENLMAVLKESLEKEVMSNAST